MHFGSFRFGAGAGIILASAVFFAGTVFFPPQREAAEIVEIEYTDEEIVSKARSLGMIFIKELPQSNPVAMTDEEIIKKAEEMGYYLVSEDIATIEPTEISGESGENVPEETERVSEETKPETAEKAVVGEDGKVTVKIVSGESSLEIARKLYDNGVVDDARAFNNYVTINSKTRKLVTGQYKFSQNMGYEQVLNILTHKKQ